MTKELTSSVLKKVDFRAQEIEIVHSDMEIQYTSELFNQMLQEKK